MLIFIVPYRDRENQKDFFLRHMKEHILKDFKDGVDYKIMIIHQKDKRLFNRGAMRNIGYMVHKKENKDSYMKDTLIFNDIDTMPYKKNYLNYEVNEGEVKHYYGTIGTLGGIVSIKPKDFEKLNGYPNYWAWGGEDNMLLERVRQHKIKVNRSQFHYSLDNNIIQLNHGNKRLVNCNNKLDMREENGISTISNLSYECNGDIIDITNFKTKNEIPKIKEVDVVKNKEGFNMNIMNMSDIFKR
tara:strand:+ start:2409 stop:3137 length:729 start_codon:yes stop_codon:yes gene_type:complete